MRPFEFNKETGKIEFNLFVIRAWIDVLMTLIAAAALAILILNAFGLQFQD